MERSSHAEQKVGTKMTEERADPMLSSQIWGHIFMGWKIGQNLYTAWSPSLLFPEAV